VFIPWTQYPSGRNRLVVKGRGPGASLATLVRQIADDVEPQSRIDQIVPLDALVARATAQPRFTSRLVASFGVLALLLASIGIFEVAPVDPPSIAVGGALLCLAALVAAFGPSRRAARVDPLVALRSE
jgi:hypothetical protein